MEHYLNVSTFDEPEAYTNNKLAIVKAILEKAYEVKMKNTKNVKSRRKSSQKLSQRDFGLGTKAKFSMEKGGKQLVLDVSLELGIPIPEVMDAYKYIVQQATNNNSQDRNKVKAIIFDQRRLMRKTFRSIIYYCFGVGEEERQEVFTDLENKDNIEPTRASFLSETLDNKKLDYHTNNILIDKGKSSYIK